MQYLQRCQTVEPVPPLAGIAHVSQITPLDQIPPLKFYQMLFLLPDWTREDLLLSHLLLLCRPHWATPPSIKLRGQDWKVKTCFYAQAIPRTSLPHNALTCIVYVHLLSHETGSPFAGRDYIPLGTSSKPWSYQTLNKYLQRELIF